MKQIGQKKMAEARNQCIPKAQCVPHNFLDVDVV